MAYVGGLRARLIHDNIYDVVKDGLEELGWLGDRPSHKPVVVRATQVEEDEKVEPNIVAVTAEDVTEEYIELGTMYAEHSWAYYVDVYGENNAISYHLAGDVKDILQGRFTSSVSRLGPDITIYDNSVQSATPIEVCTVELDRISLDKSRFSEKPFQKYWYVVSFALNDYYNNESDGDG